MSLKSLTLHNFRKHKDIRIEFGPATLVLGPNGAGKSTIVEAIRFTLTGCVYGDLKDTISIGSDEAVVELICDDDIFIRRKIGRRGSQAELRHIDNTISGSSAATKYILDYFDISEEAIDTLLARQEMMCEFFMGTESKRVNMLSSLIPGVSGIKSRYEWLTDALSEYPDYGKVEPVDEVELDRLEHKLTELRSRLSELKSKRNAAIAKQNAAKNRARIEELNRLMVIKDGELAATKQQIVKKQAELDNINTAISEIVSKIKEIEPEAASVEASVKLQEAYSLVIDDIKRKGCADGEYKAIADVLQHVADLLTHLMPKDIDRSTINKLADLRASIAYHTNEQSSKRVELSTLDDRAKLLESEIATLANRISTFLLPEDGELCDLDAEQLVAETDATMNEIAKAYEELSRKRRLLKMGKYQQKRDYINKIRDVFHWRNLSAQASAFVLGNLVDSINEYLDVLETPFKACYRDGSMVLSAVFGSNTLPDNLLSGGQRVAISVAMKLAILRLLGGRFKFIALDEPTAFLDSARISALRDLMRKVADACRNEGTKLLVISHCQDIQSAFDTVIQL